MIFLKIEFLKSLNFGFVHRNFFKILALFFIIVAFLRGAINPIYV